MSKCLENAPECIELMLQIILGKKDLKVVKSQTEYPIKSLQGRGVRFDVFARDSEGKEYDIEIQRADKGAEPRRARYNSALMDANALDSGEDFGRLRDTYVIFITENDVMKHGKDAYSYQRREDNTGECLGDGTHIIYVNGAARCAIPSSGRNRKTSISKSLASPRRNCAPSSQNGSGSMK
ncbi:MAG: PD-(D/E)XK nuclease family transposase [Kiritimatiellae bacterium]|nr:PD-(D/E)XK nuclease family transposase [Kiritimatiellia bacterium]